MVYCYAILALNTGARGCEIRALQIGDVNIPAEEIIIRTALKNKWAHRPVPLVPAALWAAKRALELAAEKGSVAPHHCLFPFRLRIGVWDNERPMTYSGNEKAVAGSQRVSRRAGLRSPRLKESSGYSSVGIGL
jgi:integrase